MSDNGQRRLTENAPDEAEGQSENEQGPLSQRT